MELKIIIILGCLCILLKTISDIQRNLYFERLELERRRNGRRPDWIIDPKETEKEN